MKLTNLSCPVCQAENLRNADVCKACGNSLGFVNVNILSDPYFQEGLEKKYNSAKADHAASEVQRFEEIVASESKAVINMPYKLLFMLVNENENYISYQRGVEIGKLLKKEFSEDRFRCVVESAFYGFDGRNIVYAALALDDVGVASYGDVSVVLQTKNIEKRTTFFEKDTLILFDELAEQGWRVKELIPTGHCGTWNERSKMAVIKHGAQVETKHKTGDFAALILRNSKEGTNDEFIELHIFNKVNPNAFEKVVFYKKPARAYDQLQFKIFKSKLTDLNIESVEK